MVRFAIIQGGKVANIVEADSVFATDQGWVDPQGAGIGWLYEGSNFTPPAAGPLAVPQSVTRRQAKQALLLAGLLVNVQPALDAIPDATQRGLMQLEWDESLEFERNRPSLLALAAGLGLDGAALDQLFITAAAL